MYRSYIEPLQDMLAAQADPKSRAWWEGYVKDGAPFLGVKMGSIRSSVHRWHRDLVATELDPAGQLGLALALIAEEHSEEKLAGTLFVQEILIPAGTVACQPDLPRFAALFTAGYIYDWNICDWFCVKVLGVLIQKEGAGCAESIAAWHSAENLWQARAALVPFTLVAGETAYYPLIAGSCRQVIRRPERFAKTGVGWVLREISKHDQAFVRSVLDDNLASFSTESLKNATRYFERSEQKDYLRKLKGAQASRTPV